MILLLFYLGALEVFLDTIKALQNKTGLLEFLVRKVKKNPAQ